MVLMRLGVVRGVLATMAVGGEAVKHGDGEPEARRLSLVLGDVFAGMRGH